MREQIVVSLWIVCVLFAYKKKSKPRSAYSSNEILNLNNMKKILLRTKIVNIIDLQAIILLYYTQNLIFCFLTRPRLFALSASCFYARHCGLFEIREFSNFTIC